MSIMKINLISKLEKKVLREVVAKLTNVEVSTLEKTPKGDLEKELAKPHYLYQMIVKCLPAKKK